LRGTLPELSPRGSAGTEIADIAEWRCARKMRRRSITAAAVATCMGCVGATTTALADTDNRVETLMDALDSTAAIVEGRVSDIAYAFDSVEGPRTVVSFSDIVTHFGSFDGAVLSIATLGGPLPDGRYLDIPELPRFTSDSRYIVFLTSSDWFFSPVVADYALRLEQQSSSGDDVLINQVGHAVVGDSALGLEFTRSPVFSNRHEGFARFEKPFAIDSAKSQLGGAVKKGSFLASLAALTQGKMKSGAVQPHPTPGRRWDIATADATAGSDYPEGEAPAAVTASDLGQLCEAPPDPESLICSEFGEGDSQ
jgi:hypothetical protein